MDKIIEALRHAALTGTDVTLTGAQARLTLAALEMLLDIAKQQPDTALRSIEAFERGEGSGQ